MLSSCRHASTSFSTSCRSRALRPALCQGMATGFHFARRCSRSGARSDGAGSATAVAPGAGAAAGRAPAGRAPAGAAAGGGAAAEATLAAATVAPRGGEAAAVSTTMAAAVTRRTVRRIRKAGGRGTKRRGKRRSSMSGSLYEAGESLAWQPLSRLWILGLEEEPWALLRHLSSSQTETDRVWKRLGCRPAKRPLPFVTIGRESGFRLEMNAAIWRQQSETPEA